MERLLPEALRRRLWLRRLKDRRWACLLDEPPAGELVSIDCETTSLDARTAEILQIAAVRITGDRLRTSEALDLLVRPAGGVAETSVRVHRLRSIDVANGVALDAAILRLVAFVGPRPLVGYYLEFDMALLDRHVRRLLGVSLPNRRIEVSGLYHDWRAARLPAGANIDLRFATIARQLDLPALQAHDAFDDAVLAALAYLRLKGPGQRGQRPHSEDG
jgi:DNA polymerase-3 subunit epsilon